MDNLTGHEIKHYKIAELLGEGGMASVYRAIDTHLGRNVALKIILPEIAAEAAFRKRFEREVRVLSQLSHPNIVGIIDYGEHDQTPYFVMEYLSGGSLKERTGQPIAYQEAARLLLPIARALAHAHQQGIIHRDVKPSNILFSDGGAPMLSDFGVARMAQSEAMTALTDTGFGIGTPEYMAPEQASGGEVDQRADIYSLGIVFYELVTGRRPFEGDTPFATMLAHANAPLPRTSVKGLPKAVEQALYKALAKDPAERFASMGEFVEVLDKLSHGDDKFDLKVKLPFFGFSWQPVVIVIVLISVVLTGILIIGSPIFPRLQPNKTGEAIVKTTRIITNTMTAIPTTIPTTTPTLTPSPTITATSTPTQTPTPILALEGTPIYQPKEIISKDNLDRFTELARWGDGEIEDWAFSGDGKLAAMATSLGVYVYDLEVDKIIIFIPTTTWATCIEFSPDNKTIVFGADNGDIEIWNIANETRELVIHTGGMVTDIEFFPDGKSIASGGFGGIFVWNVNDGSKQISLAKSDDLLQFCIGQQEG